MYTDQCILNERIGLARFIEIERQKQGRIQVLWGFKFICNFGALFTKKNTKLGKKVNIFWGPS